MTITIEEAKAFIRDADKSRQPWLTMADRSWNELKKRQKNHRLWSVTPNSLRRRARYPAWWCIFKIRQPLLLSRIGIPIGKDTTQDGNDTMGATAAICLERLAINLAKSFDFFDVMASARDDFLATNFGMVRAYYERTEVKQTVKERIQPQKLPDGDVVFADMAGKVIESDDIGQDDEGFFFEHEQVVDVDDERVCLEPLLYKDVYIDSDIRRWKRCKRLAFAEYYSVPEFKAIFGAAAYAQLPKPHDNNAAQDESYPKRQLIRVFEYWDYYERECYWWAEDGKDFITPKDYLNPNNEEATEGEANNGLYNLEKFFPVPPPLLINAPTDEFWPVPEYYQVLEILEDIHTLFSRMVAITKALRARLLFDNNIDGLQEALNEAAEGDAFGVSNLAQSLAGAGGTLEGVVQYIPVQALIEGLGQLYTALEQRLQSLFKLTGTSDLLQGLSTDGTGKTLGERQMEEKYAINQVAEPQRKMAEFVRDSYQLLAEMALKNFKDESLDRYIMPATMQPRDQQHYKAAMGMLKEDFKRFRIELETDSTIALNEDYDKRMRMELVNAATAAIEKIAATAQTSPALVVTELHLLKFMIQGMRQAKMFQSEISEAIDNVIKQFTAEQQSKPPPFDKDQVMADLKKQELQMNQQMEQAKLASNERLEMLKIQQTGAITNIETQLENFKIQSDNAQSTQGMQVEMQKIGADIAEAREQLALKRDELLVEMRKVSDKKEMDAFSLQMQSQLQGYEIQLGQQEQQLAEYKTSLDEREKYATEARLQSEHQLEQVRMRLEMVGKLHEMSMAQQPQGQPIHVNVEGPKPVKRSYKIVRDETGNLKSLEESSEMPGA